MKEKMERLARSGRKNSIEDIKGRCLRRINIDDEQERGTKGNTKLK